MKVGIKEIFLESTSFKEIAPHRIFLSIKLKLHAND